MMIIAKLKGDAPKEQLELIQNIIKNGVENGSLVYDSNYIDLSVITDKTKEEYHAL